MSKIDLKKVIQSLPSDVVLADVLPFLPSDNVQDSSAGPSLQQTESAASLQSHLNSLTLLLKMNFLFFLKNISENKSLHVFLESYLSYRTKPYLTDGDSQQGSVSLFKLDRLVFMIFFRMLSITNEHHKIPQLIPKAKITVVNTSASAGSEKKDTSSSTADLDEQFRLLLDTLKFSKFPFLLELFVIAGESNRSLSIQLFQRLVYWNSANLQVEIVKVIEETHRGCQELLQSTWQAHSRYYALEKVTIVPKKGSRVINKSALMNKATTFDVMKELHYLAAFAADIIHSLSVFLSTAKSTSSSSSLPWLATSSGFFTADGKQLTQEQGLKIVEIVMMVYETAVPTLQNVMTKARKSSSNNVTAEELALVEKMEEFVQIIQSWSLQALHHLVQVSDEAAKKNSNNSSANGKSEKASPNTRIAWTTPLSWLEVLSHRVDVKNILVGVYLDESQFRPGSLASDYLQVYDRAEINRVVKASMVVDDTENLDYYLASLCLEDSALKTKSEGESKQSSASLMASLEASSKSATSSNSGKANGNAAAQAEEAQLQEAMEAVRGIFPDLGEGFVEACVSFYNGKAEEVIDALLSNNLHPQLSALDRSMKKMWIGKQSLVQENSKLLYASNQDGKAKGGSTNTTHEDKINYKAYLDQGHDNNKAFKQVQKDLLKTIEKQQEYDAYIVDKEYDDDYDDQYDDTFNKKPLTEQDTEAFWNSEKPAKPVVTDWKQQMMETRRYNSLLKEEEKEVAFWENMRNTNRDQKVRSGRDSWKRELEQEEEEDMEDDKPSKGVPISGKAVGNQQGAQNAQKPSNNQKDQTGKQQSQQKQGGGGGGGSQPKPPQNKSGDHQNSNNNNKASNPKKDANEGGEQKGGSNGNNSSDNQKKFRTKMHDKHHQKDKALRKFGSFV